MKTSILIFVFFATAFVVNGEAELRSKRSIGKWFTDMFKKFQKKDGSSGGYGNRPLYYSLPSYTPTYYSAPQASYGAPPIAQYGAPQSHGGGGFGGPSHGGGLGGGHGGGFGGGHGGGIKGGGGGHGGVIKGGGGGHGGAIKGGGGGGLGGAIKGGGGDHGGDIYGKHHGGGFGGGFGGGKGGGSGHGFGPLKNSDIIDAYQEPIDAYSSHGVGGHGSGKGIGGGHGPIGGGGHGSGKGIGGGLGPIGGGGHGSGKGIGGGLGPIGGGGHGSGKGIGGGHGPAIGGGGHGPAIGGGGHGSDIGGGGHGGIGSDYSAPPIGHIEDSYVAPSNSLAQNTLKASSLADIHLPAAPILTDFGNGGGAYEPPTKNIPTESLQYKPPANFGQLPLQPQGQSPAFSGSVGSDAYQQPIASQSFQQPIASQSFNAINEIVTGRQNFGGNFYGGGGVDQSVNLGGNFGGLGVNSGLGGAGGLGYSSGLGGAGGLGYSSGLGGAGGLGFGSQFGSGGGGADQSIILGGNSGHGGAGGLTYGSQLGPEDPIIEIVFQDGEPGPAYQLPEIDPSLYEPAKDDVEVFFIEYSPEDEIGDFKNLDLSGAQPAILQNLPNELPYELRNHLVKSGVLENAKIEILDLDHAINDQSIDVGTRNALKAAYSRPNRQTSLNSIDNQAVDVRVQRLNHGRDTPEGIAEVLKGLKGFRSGTFAGVVEVNDENTNKYLPVTVDGDKFPLPKNINIEDKKVGGVLVLAPEDKNKKVNKQPTTVQRGIQVNRPTLNNRSGNLLAEPSSNHNTVAEAPNSRKAVDIDWADTGSNGWVPIVNSR